MAEQQELPPEEGISEEGPFDFGVDILSKISDKIRGTEENPSILRRALSALPALAAVPLMPSKGTISKAGKGLKDVVKGFTFPNLNQADAKKIIGGNASATKKAFQELPTDIQKMRATASKSALGVKEVPEAPKGLTQEEIDDILGHAKTVIGD